MHIKQIVASAEEEFPERWRSRWVAMTENAKIETGQTPLQEWLEEVYFEPPSGAELEFSSKDIEDLGRIIRSLLRLEPARRASIEDILRDPWFDKAEV